MPSNWWFKEDTSLLPMGWTWRTLAIDGSIVAHSEPFESYGKAVMDALKRGFRPTSDYWTIETVYTITRFKAGQRTEVIPKTEREILQSLLRSDRRSAPQDLAPAGRKSPEKQ